MNPYRTNAAPPPCAHRDIMARQLYGGDGPDEANRELHCNDCGAHGWEWCDRTVTWRGRTHDLEAVSQR